MSPRNAIVPHETDTSLTHGIYINARDLTFQLVQVRISQKVIMGVYPGVTTEELDHLAAETGTYCQTRR